MVQITVLNNAYIYSLDTFDHPYEVAYIESIDILMDAKKMINIGFKPVCSIPDEDKDNRYVKKSIQMSPNGRYSFENEQVYHQIENSK